MIDQSITIGIPTFNSELTILETINSLLNQSFKNWNCVISDDNSQDKTMDIICEHVEGDSRFTFLKNYVNLGQSGNFNRILNSASSEFFLLLCSDDVLYPSAIEDMMNDFSVSENISVVFGKRNMVNEVGRVLFRSKSTKDSQVINKQDAIIQVLKLASSPFAEPSFVVFRTNSLVKSGGYSNELKFIIDLDSYLKLLDHGLGVLHHSAVGNWRVRRSSDTFRLQKLVKTEMKCLIENLYDISFKNKIGSLRFILIKLSIKTRFNYLLLNLLTWTYPKRNGEKK